jgi:ribokinase
MLPTMTAPAFDVIVCGSLHLDIMLHAPSLPRPDETVAGTRWAQQCGGKGGNQAVLAARAGARVAMIGRVGADDFGERLRRHLIEAGVEASGVSTDAEAGSGMSAAIVRDDGEYGAVIVSGCNLRIEPEAVVATWRDLGGARVLALQNEAPEAVNLAAARMARADGAVVILNAAPARPMSRELADLINVLIVNRIEAGMLGEAEVAGRDGAFAVLPRLAAPGRSVMVTLGGGGVVLQPAGGEPTWIAAKAVEAISSHGAGDCFVGALAAALARGESLQAAAQFANGAAADFVSRRV